MITNILITSAGQRVSLVRAFQSEIKKINPENKVYTVDLNPILAPACHVADGFNKVQRVTDLNYIDNLIHICKNWGVTLIVPTIDTELLVLAQNKEKFLKEGIVPIVSSLDLIKKCRDKRLTNQFFEDHDIEVPEQLEKNALSFPFFIKPYDGSLSKDIFVINSKADLQDYHFQNEKLMFMEYIDPLLHDEYTVDTYYDKSGALKCVVPRKRIFVRAGEVNKAVTHKNELVAFIREKLSFIKGAVGCLTMQFFMNKKTKRIIGIEINPRFGGGYPLSYLAGANYPEYLMKEYISGKELSYVEDWEDNLLMLRYDAEVIYKNYCE